MAAARKEVFLSKVLTRLYPHTADLPTAPSQNKTQLTVTGEEPTGSVQSPAPEPADHEKSSQVKVYTASLPPDDYIAPPQSNVKPSTTEDSDLEDEPGVIRKRRRRKKKVTFIKESTADRESNIQHTPPSQTSEGVKINKNKKRKLQRKRQKERLKAEGRACQSIACQAEDRTVEQSDNQTEEDQRKKREDLLDFLQATQDLYFSDSATRCADSAPMVEQILEILDQIQSGTVPFSEVQLLHHLRSLLLLQDIERLNHSLDSFKEQSSLSVDHIKVLCSLFDYWITNILSIKTELRK
ncbi:hypothetical protein GDO78_001602 [Eleutherodactylus coqui]|uniref:Glutamate-rich protein 1 n=1 Tax=Eleutherodactylus coqui TaxID=57060 RepID=A0A8J6FTV6_ELECQ|nr:hypothetical protein GDO78_001602 [Eleutherodactylus coqui]